MKRLILASTSFRRQELLRWTGLQFEIVAPDFEESQLKREDFPSTSALVEALSFGKAVSVCDRYPESIVLSGDTLIEFEGEVIGKPKDLDDARKILKKLSGNTHFVFTGVTIIETLTRKMKTFSVESQVTFKQIPDEVLEKYVQSGEPLGKAGAYGIQQGARKFVDHIEGGWTNVIGLPLIEVCEELEQFDVKVPVNIHNVIEKYIRVKE